MIDSLWVFPLVHGRLGRSSIARGKMDGALFVFIVMGLIICETTEGASTVYPQIAVLQVAGFDVVSGSVVTGRRSVTSPVPTRNWNCAQ